MSVRNVLHLINTGGPGGAETVYVEIVRRLDPGRWHSVAVVPNREWMYEQLAAMDAEVVLTRSRLRFDRDYLRSLVRLVRERRIDLIHSHLLGPSVTAGLLGVFLRLPVVATIHGHSDLSPGERYRRIKFWAIRHGVARVVFVSEPLRQEFLDRIPLDPHRTAVVPNGIDPELYSPGRDESARAELRIAPDEFVVGAVGNLRHAKGYDVLLRAAALLKQRAPGFRFVVVGQATSPFFRDVFEELSALRAQLGLERDVLFTDFREDVPRLLRAFDLFAITSHTEGFSLSTVQAMACGLPVVATRCGGPEQILEQGRLGVLVDVNSPEQVADAIERLRQDVAGRARLGAAARQSALERFTVEAQVRAYEGIYEECLAGRRPRGRARRALEAR